MTMKQFMEIKKNFDENNLERIKKQYKMFLKEASEYKKIYEKYVSEEKWNLAMIFYCSYKQYDNYAETFKMYIDKAEENTERKNLMTKLTKAQFEEAKENIDKNNKKSVGMLYRDAKEEATEKKKEYNKYKNNKDWNKALIAYEHFLKADNLAKSYKAYLDILNNRNRKESYKYE